MTAPPTFCADALTRKHYARAVALVVASGYELGDGDEYVLGPFANAAARLEELAERLAKERKLDRRLRLMRAERLARADFARLTDALERHYPGVEVEESAVLERTGTGGDVLAFPYPGPSSAVGQRIVAALERTSAPLTREELRKRVRGGRASFLAELKTLVKAGTIERGGRGTRSAPHRYSRRA